MGFDYEKVEKAWFKPKKTVLDELEEWLNDEENPAIEYDWECKYDYIYTDELLDKIQELKKESK